MLLSEESLQVIVQWFESWRIQVPLNSFKLKLSFSTEALEQMRQNQGEKENPESTEAQLF